MNTVPAVYVNIIKWKFNSNWVCLLNWKLLGCEHSYISVQIAVSLELHELSIRIKPISGAVAGGAYISHSLQPDGGGPRAGSGQVPANPSPLSSPATGSAPGPGPSTAR